jgi:hypothetical protein
MSAEPGGTGVGRAKVGGTRTRAVGSARQGAILIARPYLLVSRRLLYAEPDRGAAWPDGGGGFYVIGGRISRAPGRPVSK